MENHSAPSSLLNDFDRVAGGFSREDSSSPMGLFRPEALDAAADNGLGRPVALLPISWGILTSILLGMAVAFTTLLLTGRYTRKESAIGIVRTAGGDVPVTVLTSGIVRRVVVKEGQHVTAGQTLLVIDTARSGVDGRLSDKVTIESLDTEIASLRERLTALNAATTIATAGAPAKLAALRGERQAAVSQQASARERLRLAEDALRKIEPVALRGFISGEAMRQRKEEVISLRQMISDAGGAIARLDGQISEAEVTNAQRPMVTTQERGQLLDQLSSTQRERSAASLQQGFAIVAPTEGIISAVQIGVGEPVNPQRAPMIISSPTTAAYAEVFVPSRAIGFLETGQKVRVRYDAFPYQRFGTATGTVKAISSNVLRPQEIEAAIRTDEPVYRVVVRLDRATVAAYGKKYRIRPGLALTADVVLDERRFADWLLDPILALRGKL